MTQSIHPGKTSGVGNLHIVADTGAARYDMASEVLPIGVSDMHSDAASSRSFDDQAPPVFTVGCRVMLGQTSPIESEGVAPAPGDEGELIASPVLSDKRRCWTVRFYGYSLPWNIPEQHLIPVIRR